MRRLRSHLLALVAASLLVMMSITSAFGARPWETVDGETAPNRGLQVAAFVHGLLTGDEEGDEEPAEEEPVDEENADEEQTEEEEQTEDSEEVESEEASSHGQCVSEWARGDEVGGPNENHGWVVSFAAQVLCWVTEVTDDTEETEETAEPEDTEATDADEATEAETELQESGPGKSAAAHERNAERKAAHAERKAAHAAQKAAQKAAKVQGGKGHSFGRGGRR